MRLLYVIDSLVPSGAERSLAALAPEYVARGVSLDVAYLLDRPGLQAELESAGAGLFSLAGPGGRLGWVRRARGLIRERRPDLVHTTLGEADLAGRVAARLERTPAVSSLVNESFGAEQRRAREIPAWKMRAARAQEVLTARWVRRFHAITQYVADVMSRRLRIPRDRVDVIPRGRDAGALGVRSQDRREAARSTLGVGPDTPVVLAVGRQERQKGLDVLLRAFPRVLARMPGARLLIAGREGNETPALRSAAEALGLGEAIRFLGMRDDVPELLCAADVFVMPSRWEGLGSVLLEAMALEAPIVVSDLPAVREVVEHDRTAVLVPLGKPEPLAEAVADTLADRDAASNRAGAARDRFLHSFTIDRVAAGMIQFYERALHG